MPFPEVYHELLGTEHMGPKGWIRQVLCFELPEDYDMYVEDLYLDSTFRELGCISGQG